MDSDIPAADCFADVVPSVENERTAFVNPGRPTADHSPNSKSIELTSRESSPQLAAAADWDPEWETGATGSRVHRHNTAKMSTWIGQPGIKGYSETVRMALLTCVSVGITFVPSTPTVWWRWCWC